VFVTAIVARAWVALRILIGHGRAECIKDGTGGNIFGGDQKDGFALALDLAFLEQLVFMDVERTQKTHHYLGDIRVCLHQGFLHELLRISNYMILAIVRGTYFLVGLGKGVAGHDGGLLLCSREEGVRQRMKGSESVKEQILRVQALLDV
jgi:hypothetical protein